MGWSLEGTKKGSTTGGDGPKGGQAVGWPKAAATADPALSLQGMWALNVTKTWSPSTQSTLPRCWEKEREEVEGSGQRCRKWPATTKNHESLYRQFEPFALSPSLCLYQEDTVQKHGMHVTMQKFKKMQVACNIPLGPPQLPDFWWDYPPPPP